MIHKMWDMNAKWNSRTPNALNKVICQLPVPISLFLHLAIAQAPEAIHRIISYMEVLAAGSLQ